MFLRCDASMCDSCRTQVGMISLGGVDSVDKCPKHVGKEDAFVTVVMTAREAEAIRRRNRFTVVNYDKS